MNRCEDYPCCGHTDGLGCNWTYTPEAQAFDMAHSMCEHEMGYCEAYEDECDPHNSYCANDDEECDVCREYWLDFHAESMMEDADLDGRYEQ